MGSLRPIYLIVAILFFGPLLTLVSVPSLAEVSNADDDREWMIFEPAKDSGCDRTVNGKGVEVKGDFDGNGVADIVRIQINKKLKKARLAVWLNSEKEPIVLQTWIDLKEDNYIGLVDPGDQETLCGKDDDCEAGELPEFSVKQQAIAFGTCESSQAIYYWDPKAKKFQENWTSD